MGIETVIAIAAIAASAAGTGAQVHQGRVAAAKAKDAERDQEAAVRDQNAKLAEDQSKLDATTAARQARVRQRALLAGSQGNSATIATSPLGLAPGASGTPNAGGGLKTLGE